MNEAVKIALPVIAVLVSCIAGYFAGKRDGYAEAVKEYLDNLERQKTKNWYRLLHQGRMKRNELHGNRAARSARGKETV